MLYRLEKKLFALAVNILNVLLAGNLPPFVSVCTIIEEQGRFLVVESSKEHFSFPGGFVRWLEHPVQAARRESEEETGLVVRITEGIGCYPIINSRFADASCLVVVFHAEVVAGVLRRSGEGKPRWLEESEVRLKMDTLRLKMLDDYLRSQASRSKPEAAYWQSKK